MSKASRTKGQRIEREIVHRHQDAGIPAERVPLSGAAGGSYTGDIIIADTWRTEVKGRGDGEGFTLIKRWLGTNDMLFLREDRSEPLVVLPWAVYQRLVLAALQEPNHHNGAPIEVSTEGLKQSCEFSA